MELLENLELNKSRQLESSKNSWIFKDSRNSWNFISSNSPSGVGVDMTVPSTISVPLVLRFLEILEHDKLTFSQNF